MIGKLYYYGVRNGDFFKAGKSINGSDVTTIPVGISKTDNDLILWILVWE